MKREQIDRKKIRSVIENVGIDNTIFDISTAELTSIKTGGRALCYLVAHKLEDLKRIIETCIKNGIKFMVIGYGTNILFSDEYIDLVLIRLGRDFNYVNFTGKDEITAGSACNLLKFVVSAAVEGYDFSELSGIPGTIGGSIVGNSGNKNKGICSFIEKVSYVSNEGGVIKEKTRILKENNFNYRYFHIPKLVALTGAVLKTRRTKKDNILKEIRSRIKNKKLIQPINSRSSGCFFKNVRNSNKSTGELIEECGLKGFNYGGARVSARHANFIENYDNASSEDIFVLSKIIRDMVMDKFKIDLEYEVKVIGF